MPNKGNLGLVYPVLGFCGQVLIAGGGLQGGFCEKLPEFFPYVLQS